jgi:FAD/FMN-containing dehydrogenase
MRIFVDNAARVRFVAPLAAEVQGPVLVPGDDGYADEVAPFNLAMTPRPAVVVGATCAADIASAVRFATGRGLPVGVQATGHGAVAPMEGGLLVSTRRMTTVRIDPPARTATIGAGVRWRDVIPPAAVHGLAPLNGSSPGVGAVGYIVGGGLPVMGRTFGFAADRVRAFEVVTADGSIHSADVEHEPELFWALRGGKGNVGIVTELVTDLVPVRRLYGGGLFYPGSAAPAVLAAYREWTATVPDTMSSSLALLRLPPTPEVPEPLRGQFVVHLRVAFVGDTTDGERLVAPMRSAAPVLIDAVFDMPYTDVGSIHRDPEGPLPVYDRGTLLRELSPDAIQALLAVAGPDVDTPLTIVQQIHLGGALAAAPAVPSAIGARDAAFAVYVVGALAPPVAAAVPAAAEAAMIALRPYSTGGTLVNFHGAPGDAADRARPWPPTTYSRLRRAKATYDPGNVFAYGHAVPP